MSKRPEITKKILEILATTSFATADLLDFMFSGAHRMGGEQFKALKKRSQKRHSDLEKYLIDSENKQKFYSLLYKLQREGLVTKKKNNISAIISITDKGKKRLAKLLSIKTKKLPDQNYRKIQSRFSKIIIFDIPEKEQNKRAWLRFVLKNLGFAMLQKSVWFGKNELPEELISDLKELGMLSYVKIFSVHNDGNINL